MREVTIDEYPVFLLHLSQPLHMEYIPKGCFSMENVWNDKIIFCYTEYNIVGSVLNLDFLNIVGFEMINSQ